MHLFKLCIISTRADSTKRFNTRLYSPIYFLILTAFSSCLPFVICIHLCNFDCHCVLVHQSFKLLSPYILCMPFPSPARRLHQPLTPLSLSPTPLLTLTLPRSQGMRQPQNPVFSAYILKEPTYLPPRPSAEPPNPPPTRPLHPTLLLPPHFSLLPLPPLHPPPYPSPPLPPPPAPRARQR